jgi:hypothetical protein
MKNKNKVRINLAVSDELKQRIDDLIEESDAENVTQLIKYALILYEKVIKNSKNGGSLEIIDSEGNRREILL